VSTGNSIVFPYGLFMSDSTSLSIFTDQGLTDVQAQVCTLIATGQPLKKALELAGTTEYRYSKWLVELPAFERAVMAARVMIVQRRVDHMSDVARNEPDINRAKVIIDTDKWLASKLISRVYGDKLDVNVTTTIDLAGALAEAKERAALRLRRDSDTTIEGEFETVPSVATNGSIDTQSVPPPIPDIFS
jgi:hypothetical protein